MDDSEIEKASKSWSKVLEQDLSSDIGGERIALTWRRRLLFDRLSQLEADACEAEAILGKDYRNLCSPLRRLALQYNAALNCYLMYKDNPEEWKPASGEYIQWQATIFGHPDSDRDLFGGSIEQEIEKLQSKLRPFLLTHKR